MTAAVDSGPLRLPRGEPRAVSTLPAGSPRAWLEELRQRRFNGRVMLEGGDRLADLLLRDGLPIAASYQPGSDCELALGQPALSACLAGPVDGWSCQTERLEPSLLGALAGLAAEPRPCGIETIAGLRALLRDLAARGENGVLELRVDGAEESRWARVVVAEGRLLGAYSADSEALVTSLEPLGGVLDERVPQTWWFSAPAESLEVPPVEDSDDGLTSAIERQVTWAMSRFEADWGRARERGGGPEALKVRLAALLDSLLALADHLEGGTSADDPVLAQPLELLLRRRPPNQIDQRLAGLSGDQASKLLAQEIGQALGRIARCHPTARLAESCQQAATALHGELEATLAAGPSMSRTARE